MSAECHISSLVVHARPERADTVRAAIEALAGVEVHAADESGKLVLTMETDSEQAIVSNIDHINGIDGILSTVLIYHHSEDEASLAQEFTHEDHASGIR